MTSSRGQALVEFCVMVGVFVALGIGLQMVAGWQRAQRNAVLAAREAAFSSVWQLPSSDAATRAQRAVALHFDGVLGQAPGQGESLVDHDRGISVRGDPLALGDTASGLMRQLMQPVQAAAGWMAARLELQPGGLQQSRVEVTLASLSRLPAPWSDPGPVLVEQAAVLGDNWAATGPDQVRQRSAGLVPSHALAAPLQALRPLLWPARVLEPSLGQLCIGLIEPERVPADRVAGGAPGSAQPGDPACH